MKLPAPLLRRHGSPRGFRQAKRREAAAVDRALEQLRFGCYHMQPEARQLTVSISEDVKRLRELLSVKVWGR